MDRIWLKNYPAGVPAEIDVSQYPSLVALFEESFAKYGKNDAYVCMDKKLTFGQLDEMSRALGAWLQGKGLKRGDRVAIMMPNVLQYPVASPACCAPATSVVNVNPLYTPRELEHQLKDSGAEGDHHPGEFRHDAASRSVAATPVKHVVLASMGDLLGFPKGAIVNLVVRQGEEDGAGLLAARRDEIQRCGRAGRRMQLDQARDQPRRRRLPAVHRRHHRRLQGRHAAAPQRHRQRAADRGLAAAGAREGQAGRAA